MAVALALVITGTPVVTTVCQGVCATRETDSGITGEHHSCHHQPAPASQTAITSTVHNCGHSDEGSRAIGQSLWSLAAPAVIVSTFVLASPSVEHAQRRASRAEHGPPDTSPHHAQLRI